MLLLHATIRALEKTDPSSLEHQGLLPQQDDKTKALILRRSVARHLLLNAHRTLASDGGELTVGERLLVMTAETGMCGTKIVTKPMISYRVQLAKNFGTGRYTSLPPQWDDL